MKYAVRLNTHLKGFAVRKTSGKSASRQLYRSVTDGAKDAANKNMIRNGRKSWNEEDHDVFTKEFFKSMKVKAGYEVYS